MSLSAYIDATGIHAPSYAEVLAGLQANYRAIYGADVYLGNDSQDGQLLAAFAQAISDCNSTAVAVYNSFSPATAQGAGLSSLVKINGIARNVASKSQVDVAIGGTAGTVINTGIVSDGTNKWNLPAIVTIPLAGTITVTATAQALGAISAAPHAVNQIFTPTAGWQTVDNTASAVAGAPVENDAQLRVRQSAAVALRSTSPLDGIYSAISVLPGVEAIKIYENDTGSTDSNGVPAHSISPVVLGGDVVAIAQAIVDTKNPGTGTHGTTSETVTNASGVATTVNFYRPTNVPVDVHITVKALTGYVSTTTAAISAALSAYIGSLPFGAYPSQTVQFTKLIQAALSVITESTYNVTALTFRRDSNSFATTDVPIAFNEAPQGGTITVTVT